VPREITSIFGKRKVVLREIPRPVTPFEGLSVFVTPAPRSFFATTFGCFG
jgi:hypothetical protein